MGEGADRHPTSLWGDRRLRQLCTGLCKTRTLLPRWLRDGAPMGLNGPIEIGGASPQDPMRQVTFFEGTGAPKLAPNNRAGASTIALDARALHAGETWAMGLGGGPRWGLLAIWRCGRVWRARVRDLRRRRMVRRGVDPACTAFYSAPPVGRADGRASWCGGAMPHLDLCFAMAHVLSNTLPASLVPERVRHYHMVPVQSNPLLISIFDRWRRVVFVGGVGAKAAHPPRSRFQACRLSAVEVENTCLRNGYAGFVAVSAFIFISCNTSRMCGQMCA